MKEIGWSKSIMSSLRNAVPRPAHKEGSQPQDRKKFGLLEKHKDYKIRANKYHDKQNALKKLWQKAANKNPDEFYFKMINSKTVKGVHRPKEEVNKYSAEELMLMKTQDIGYVSNCEEQVGEKVDGEKCSLGIRESSGLMFISSNKDVKIRILSFRFLQF